MPIAAFLAIAILAVVSPGPDSLLVIRNTVSSSRRAGLYTAIGIAAGNLIHVGYSLVGIGLIIAKSIFLFTAIKTAGAAYLLFLGFKAVRAKPAATASLTHAPMVHLTDSQAFRTGFMCNVLNPKCTMFFLALFTQLLNPATSFAGKALYGLSLVAIAFSWFSLLTAMLSLPSVRERFTRFGHHAERAMGAMLMAIGIKVLVSHSR